MNKLEILSELTDAGMTIEAACAMGGNMMAESTLKANIAQRGMTKLSDEEYTKAADTGTIDFVNDAVGYGLCQWTHKTRKANLLNYAKRFGKSVGDGRMQVRFCVEELKTDYPALWSCLCETQDAYMAAERICREYERPAVNNITARQQFAQELYVKYAEALTANPSTASGPPPFDKGGRNPSTASGPPPFDKGGISDAEPASCVLTEVTNGRTPEAKFLAALLDRCGYDVLWEGVQNCLIDFRQKTGLAANGSDWGKTWVKLREVNK